jgi:hypothetical protein
MNRTRIAALAITALALAGCGGSAASTSGASPAAPTVAQVASQIGATGVTAIDPTLYASHEGDATWKGQKVDIATFSTDALRDKWEAVAKEFGPILTDGPGYAVTTG